jgi:hypothetical protein
MKLSKEFKEIFTQSLLDTYNVKCLSMEKVEMDGFIRYAFEGHVDNVPFAGSLNLILQSDGHCDFSVSGWFVKNHRAFCDSITKNNSYVQAIKEVNSWLTSNFGRRIENQIGRFWIGIGSFLYKRGSITNIIINMTPSSTGKLKIVTSSADKFIGVHLLDYSFFEKNDKSNFNYRSNTDHALCSPVDVDDNNVDLELFKKRLVREYMLAYAQLTESPNILSVDEFNTLSYEHIIDYLTVQKMQDI